MKIKDPRSYGSQNAGATNIMRSGNKKAAILTLLGDVLKGLLIILLARFVTRGIDGGDAIVAARHMSMMNYDATIMIFRNPEK